MNDGFFPADTAAAVKIDKLVRLTDKRPMSERMSSRMVRCASVMGPGAFIGWQMLVPAKGLVGLYLFGTEPLCRDDLEWILEKTGKTSGRAARIGYSGSRSYSGSTGHSARAARTEVDPALKELYEICLPIAESSGAAPSIGFGIASPGGNRTGSSNRAGAGTRDGAGDEIQDGFAKWPSHFSDQFEELLRVLRAAGAALRATAGPPCDRTSTAGPPCDRAQIACRKNTLRTYDVRSVPPNEYIGKPVKVRVLLRLPGKPSVRLRTVIEEAVQGAKLRYIGSMDDPMAGHMWERPLEGAVVLPDYAARIMMMEPEVREAVDGIGICEEEMKKIPASHRNTKDKKAVTIGHATDTSGIRRKITIGETDLKRHYQIVGQTGTGKSTLLTTLILSAIEQGHGLTFFDPHGSTIDVVLRSLPEKYAGRVRVVRIGDIENPVPLNIWDSDDPAEEERTINDLCELFGDIFNPPGGGEFVGPRWERWFTLFAKASIAYLGRRASLESIAVIAQSQDNMLKVCKVIIGKYPELVDSIKQEFGLDRSSDFNATLAWFLSKFQRLTAVEQLRLTLGAGANALDFGHSIDTDTVTLIDLASPAIGTHAARIVGTLLLMKLWNAAMARKERDRTHLVLVDEAALFQTNPMPRMLAEARKFGISMVLCHQHAGQLTPEIRDALEANAASFSAFRLSPRDAATAAIRFDDPGMQVFLTRLDAFNAITTISVDGKQTTPFTLETIRPKRLKNSDEIAGRIEARSIETLVEPYRDLRALTAAEIRNILDHPEKRKVSNPAWLEEWNRRKRERNRAV